MLELIPTRPARRWRAGELAGPAGISDREARAILDEVATAAAGWRDHVRQAGVGTRTATRIGKAIEQCLARL